jgi:hypothetical protein
MNSVFRSICIAGGFLLLAGVQNASAQIIYPVEFTTSFPFTVGYATVPAGRYTVTADEDNPEIFELRGAHTSVLFQAQNATAGETPTRTEVVFKRFGDGYVLKDIWLDGSNSGAETIPVEGERHAAKHRGPVGEQRVVAQKKTDTARNR